MHTIEGVGLLLLPTRTYGAEPADRGVLAQRAHMSFAALQEVTPAGGSARLVTVPLFGSSTPNLTTENGSCSTSTKCATYSLFVPPSNPLVGTSSSTGTTYTGSAAGEVFYRVNARDFLPGLTGSNCSPSSLTTDKQSDGATALAVTPGAISTAQTLSFTGCQAGN